MPGARFVALFASAAVLGLFLTYAGVRHNVFQYDDFHSVADNPHIRSDASLSAFFYQAGSQEEVSGFARAAALFSADPARAMYRPLLLVSYVLNMRSGLGFHLVNLGIHLACVGWVCLLGRQCGLDRWTAAGAAGLFALHPLQSEAVNYLSARSESLAALFYLAALAAFVHGIRTAKKTYLAAGLVAGAAALAVKAIAVTLPAALAWYLVRTRERRLAIWGWWLAAAGLALAYTLMVRGALATALGQPVRPLGVQLLTQVKAWGYYLYLGIAPLHLSVEHPFTEAAGFSLAVIATGALGGSGIWVVWAWKRRQILTASWPLWAGWAAIALIPASVVPLNVLVNEHRLYLPMAFACPLVAWALSRLPGRWRWGSTGALLLVLALLAHQRSQVWRSEVALWQDAVAKAPMMYRGHMHLGGAWQKQGRHAVALDHFERAVHLDPSAVEAHYNLGNALAALGRLDAAILAYNEAVGRQPGFAPAWLNLASAYIDAGRLDEAERALTGAASARADPAQVALRRALVWRRRGNLTAAAAEYELALTMQPGLVAARYNLANLQADSGRFAEAVGLYRQVLARQPEHLGARRNLGDLLIGQGAYDEAAEVFAAGLRRHPGEAILYYGLARSYEGAGRPEAAKQQYRRLLQRGIDARLQAIVKRRLQAIENKP